MGRPPSIQWYYKQWLGDNKVLAMDWDAKAMHFHLLMMSIQEEPVGSIPADDAVIRRWLMLAPNDSVCCQRNSDRRESGYGCRCADCVWRRVRPQIIAAWACRDNRWFNAGMVATNERAENYKTRYETGTKKARDSMEIEVEVLDPVISKKIIEPYLGEIYKFYPRKVAKGAAFKAISAALDRLVRAEDSPSELFHSLDDAVIWLTQRVKVFAASPAGQQGEYTPHPATWFNQKRYLDDESEWSRDGKDRRDSQEIQRQPSKQAERYDHNLGVLLRRRAAAAGGEAGVADSVVLDVPGQKARSGPGNN